MAEYITNGEGDEVGNIVLSKVVGNKQLNADFVPFDPRREEWSGPANSSEDDITYAIDQTDDAIPLGSGLNAAQTTAAIDTAMVIWENVNSTNLPIVKKPDLGADWSVIAFLYSLIGGLVIATDIRHWWSC